MPVNPMLSGRSSVACSMRAMFQEPGVQVVAFVPVAGPVPPPTQVVMPLATASNACCGEMKWMCVSTPPAVKIRPSPAMASVVTPTIMPGVTPAITSGFPAFPIPAIRPSLMPTSALTIPVQSTMSALVITQSSASASLAPAFWPMPSRSTLPPPNLHSSP